MEEGKNASSPQIDLILTNATEPTGREFSTFSGIDNKEWVNVMTAKQNLIQKRTPARCKHASYS